MNRLRGYILSLFPPKRRPITWRSWLPLALFLLAFIGACVALDLLDVVLFTYPLAFALLALAPWVWWMSEHGYSGLRGWRGTASMLVRLLLLGVFIVLLAEPRAVRKDDALSVVFVLDQSQSMRPEALEASVKYITKLAQEKPEKDEVGLVTFGRGAVVEMPPSQAFPFEGLAVQVDRDGTSLEQALSLGAAVLPEEHAGRIVLISDGVETDGNVELMLDELKSRNVAVDVLPVAYDYEKEVLVERLELPRVVRLGESYEAVATVWAAHAGKARLVLQENGQPVFEQEVSFTQGKNRFAIPIYLRDPGYYEYTATLEPPRGEDSWAANNKAVSYLFLRGEGRVLVVTNPEGNPADHQPFVRALEESERRVQVMTPFEVPSDPLALMPFDAIVFANVPADQFAITQMHAIQRAVADHGMGFLMLGGGDSYGPGGWHRTPVEEVLPVTMDATQRKILPKSALAIVLHTCEFANGNTWAKEITKAAIKVLGAEDEVGVLVFDFAGRYSWLFPLTPAGDYARIAPLINNAQIGDMPDFASTMQMGLAGLQASDAMTKHMIIISDGDPQPPSPQLLAQYVASQISVSTVAVFPHGNSTQVMQQIAATTGGRFYFPQDPKTLPQIFIKEAKTLRRSMIQNKTFTPAVDFPSPILKGIDAMPALHGYVITTPKARSETVLSVPDAEEPEPVLATWRHGLGKTAAFTSDLSPNWGKDWLTWERYRAFVQQLMIEVSRVAEPSNLRLQTFAAGSQGVVVVEDYAEEAGFLNITARVDGPREDPVDVPLQQVGPRRYEARFPLDGEGRYQVTAIASGAGAEEEAREERAHGGLMVAYSQEFLRLRSNPLVMERVAERTGGRVLTGEEKGTDVFVEDRPETQRSLPVFDWFLVALACLVPLDVAMRRVQVDWQSVKLLFGAGVHKPSDETFTKLLHTKRSVSEKLTTSTSEDLLAARRRQAEVAPVATAAPERVDTPKRATTSKTPATDATSTTGALLARRRAMRGDDDNNA